MISQPLTDVIKILDIRESSSHGSEMDKIETKRGFTEPIKGDNWYFLTQAKLTI